MTKPLTAIMIALLCAGCGTIDSLRGYFGKDKAGPDIEWRTGTHTIEVDDLDAWEATIKIKGLPQIRPNPGEAETMLWGLSGPNLKADYYARHTGGKVVGLRHRIEGKDPAYKWRMSGYFHGHVGTDAHELRLRCEHGVLRCFVNGSEIEDYYPLNVPGAKLRKLTISHDPTRPMRGKWQAEVREL